MESPQAHILKGNRLHLQHGPIDLIIKAWGKDCADAYQQARERFQTILGELVEELDQLRCPVTDIGHPFHGKVARRMMAATAPHSAEFVTPMAAVAGSVADEILGAMCAGLSLDKAYVNNGGDIAFHLEKGQELSAAIIDGNDAGRVRLTHNQPVRGLATSGWRGRSLSLGIADAVTVVAKTAAAADCAATLIANAVDLPVHPAVTRQSATQIAPDSDLGDRLVTVDVGNLPECDISTALTSGHKRASNMLTQGHIAGAALFLSGHSTLVGNLPGTPQHINNGEIDARLQTA